MDFAWWFHDPGGYRADSYRRCSQLQIQLNKPEVPSAGSRRFPRAEVPLLHLLITIFSANTFASNFRIKASEWQPLGSGWNDVRPFCIAIPRLADIVWRLSWGPWKWGLLRHCEGTAGPNKPLENTLRNHWWKESPLQQGNLTSKTTHLADITTLISNIASLVSCT